MSNHDNGRPISDDYDEERILRELEEEENKHCLHEFVSREYFSQPYGTCASCGRLVLGNKDYD